MREKSLLAAKLLYKFLKKECVLYAYITNVMEQHRDDYGFRELYGKSDILGIITLCGSSIYWAFDWDETKEGYLFWSALNDEFIRFIRQF
jgi:hypothetical protein